MIRFIRIFTTLILTVLLGIVVTTIALTRLHIIPHISFYVVSSGSMEPVLKTGAVVFVQQVNSYNIGDIITFKNNGNAKNLVTHRIVSRDQAQENLSFTTKGDANKTADQDTVLAQDVVGKVMLSLPYAGSILARAKTPVGFILLVIVPATILVYEELKTIYYEFVAIGKRIFRKKNKPSTSTLTHSDELFLQSVKLMRDEERVRIDPLIGVVIVFLGAGMTFVRMTMSFFSDTEHSSIAYAVTQTPPTVPATITSPSPLVSVLPTPTVTVIASPQASSSGLPVIDNATP